MARLPNADRAFVDVAKLTDYALNPAHRTGRHKARVFASALGMSAADAETLAARLVEAALTQDCQSERRDRHGDHYSLEFMLEFRGRSAAIRSLWTVRTGEDFPRLVSAFVA